MQDQNRQCLEQCCGFLLTFAYARMEEVMKLKDASIYVEIDVLSQSQLLNLY